MGKEILEFVDRDGETLTEEEVRTRVEESVRELRDQLRQALSFKKKLNQGTLKNNDCFLDFSAVLENGYDRTGPDYTTAELS